MRNKDEEMELVLTDLEIQALRSIRDAKKNDVFVNLPCFGGDHRKPIAIARELKGKGLIYFRVDVMPELTESGKQILHQIENPLPEDEVFNITRRFRAKPVIAVIIFIFVAVAAIVGFAANLKSLWE